MKFFKWKSFKNAKVSHNLYVPPTPNVGETAPNLSPGDKDVYVTDDSEPRCIAKYSEEKTTVTGSDYKKVVSNENDDTLNDKLASDGTCEKGHPDKPTEVAGSNLLMSDDNDQSAYLLGDKNEFESVDVDYGHTCSPIYMRLLHVCADRSFCDRFYSGTRGKPLLWCMLAILISNPFIGLYILHNVDRLESWMIQRDVTGVQISHDYSMLNDAAILPHRPRVDNLADSEVVGFQDLKNDERDPQDPNLASDTYTSEIGLVASLLSQKIRWYAFYEIFGEIIFAFFALVLLCVSGLCCRNGRRRTQSMMPFMGLFYTLMYKVLTLYIFVVSLRLMFIYAIVAMPRVRDKIPGTLLKPLSFGGIDITNDRQRNALDELIREDLSFHKLVVIYCLENVYITVSDFAESVCTTSRILLRMVRKFVKKIKRQQDLVYFTVNSLGESQTEFGRVCGPCSYVFLDGLFSRNVESQESYIHEVYNRDLEHVGTYLDNVDIEQYKDGIGRFGAKLLKS